MKKYIIKNCPSIWTHSFNKNTWLCENGKDCKDIPDCLLKRIVSLCKENQFFGYGAIILENGLSADILNLLEIEEVYE